MKKIALTLCLCLIALAGLAPLHAQQCKVAATGIAAVTGGYTVTLPPQVAYAVPTNEPLRLAIRDAAGNVSSVAGPVRLLSTGQLWIQTSERFAFSPQQCPAQIGIQKASENDCLLPEFGIECWALTWCAGQNYCIPGDGPGGFTCSCV